jgi:hypothetical protein
MSVPALLPEQYQLSDDGVLLNDDAVVPFFDVVSVQGLDNAPVRSVITPREGQSGSWIDAQYNTERTVVLEGNAYANSNSIDSYLTSLKSNWKASNILQSLYFGTQEGVRMVKGYPLGFNYTKDSGKGRGIVSGQMQFTCPDYRIYDANATTLTTTLSAATDHAPTTTVLNAGTSTSAWSSSITGYVGTTPHAPTVSLVSSSVVVEQTNAGQPGPKAPYAADAIYTDYSGHKVPASSPFVALDYRLDVVNDSFASVTYYVNDIAVRPVFSSGSFSSSSGHYTLSLRVFFYMPDEFLHRLRVVATASTTDANQVVDIKFSNLKVTQYNSIAPLGITNSSYVDVPFTVGGNTATDWVVKVSDSATTYGFSGIIQILDASNNSVALVKSSIPSPSGVLPWTTLTWDLTFDSYNKLAYFTYNENALSPTYLPTISNPWTALSPGSYVLRLYNVPTSDVAAIDVTFTYQNAWS